MRIGTLCFAISRGLGYLARSFYEHDVIQDVAVIRHGSIETHMEWYPDGIEITTRPFLNSSLRNLIRRVDVMLFFETPFDWHILEFCRQQGVKTVLMMMYECTPDPVPIHPDLWLCPSLLDLEYCQGHNSTFLPIPVDLARTPWRLRTTANVFVHNGGYLGLQGREGTNEVIEAWQHVQSDAKLIVTSQKPIDDAHRQMCERDPRIEYHLGTRPLESLYEIGDVAIGAQKWNGCSLPLQEAFASGLLVMNTNRFPVNTWLPTEPLIRVARTERGRAARGMQPIDIARVNPRDIAAKVDEWHGRDITEYSQAGREWAEANSWDVLLPRYEEALQSLF